MNFEDIINTINNNKKLKLTILSLGALFAFVLNLYIKFNFISKMHNLNLKEEYALFSTEMAFHYRHLKMVVEKAKIPEIDYEIQYPEGLNIKKYETPFMDIVLGNIYKLFFKKLIPLHIFAVYSSMIFYALTVLVLFLGVYLIFNSIEAAIFSSLFYALIPANFMRNISGFYSREDFALPFMFLSFILYIASLKRENFIYIIFASISLFISLLTWHFAQLYLNVFVTGVVIIYFILKIKKENLPKVTFFSLFVTVAFSSLFIPILRSIFFIFSPASMLLLAILICELFFPLEKKRLNFLINIGIIVFSLLVSIVLQRITSGQSHAFSLLFYKLLYFNKLPDDASRLPFEVKVMWAANTMGDDIFTIAINFLSILVLFPLALFFLMTDFLKNKNIISIVLFYFSFIYFIFYLLINRMSVFAAFFVSLAIAVLFIFNNKNIKLLVFSLGIVILIGHLIFLLNFKYDPFIFEDKNAIVDLYNYIKQNTKSDAVILANFELSPGIALYTNRKVNLHSKFESSLIRKKVEEYYVALYGENENSFYEFCKKNKTDYFIYPSYMALNTEKGGHMYYANALPLSTKSNVFKFHFKPEKLEHFMLVYQNDMYRVYSVMNDKISNEYLKTKLEYLNEPIFDLLNFTSSAEPVFLTKEELNNGFNKSYDSRYLIYQAEEAYRKKYYERAFIYYKRFFQNTTFYQPQFVKNYLDLLIRFNKKDELYIFLNFALESLDKIEYENLDIRDADYWFILSKVNFMKNKLESAKKAIEKAINYKLTDENVFLLYSMILEKLNQSDKALFYLKKVLVLNPENISALNGVVYLYSQKGIGDRNFAINCAEKSLKINPTQAEVLVELKKIKGE